MTVEPGWVPPGIDTTKANVARVYDYWLGGDHNFQADRDLARTIIALDPNIPTENAVHQVAQETAPGSRVVYVDNDDVAVAHSRLLLAGNPDAAVIQGDLREPVKILADQIGR